MQFNEQYISPALARVCNSEGGTIGTAFFVLAEGGVALTCHHLVAGRDTVLLDCGDGRLRTGQVGPECFPELDVAVVRCPDAAPRSVLPIEAADDRLTRYWTKGFHYLGEGVTAAYPVTGDISGVTDIQFAAYGETNYHLQAVLVLTKDDIEPGLSGAPVVDPETGVAFALVNAKYNRPGMQAGFALPLAQVKPKLPGLFAANRQTVPRYGRFLNQLGAAEVCRLGRAAILERLTSSGLFLREMYCARAAENLVAAFCASNFLILPIVGNSGVGKTMLLAELARRAHAAGTVLLLAGDLRAGDADLAASLTSLLREVAQPLLGSAGDATSVAAALGEDGQQLLVLLDALNETPARLVDGLGSWLGRTIPWLEKTNTRLVVSSRPEFWQVRKDLFPPRLIFTEGSGEQARPVSPEGLQLGDFNEQEAEAARERYNLRGALSASDLRHPLMARVYHEIQAAEPDGKLAPTDRYRALRRFIQIKSDNVARALGPAVVRAYVESGLSRAAQAALDKGGLEISQAEFFHLFADQGLGNQLVQEGLFTPTSSGSVRFAFDEVAEFLQGQLLGLTELTGRFAQTSPDRQRLPTGAIVYALLRFDDEAHEEQFEEAVRALVTAHGQNHPDAYTYENVFGQLLSQLRRPGRFTPEIEAVFSRLAARKSYYPSQYDPFKLRRTVAALELPAGVRLNLLKPFLLKEDSYDFEHHHWPDLERYVIRGRGHTGALIADVLRSAPQASFETLTQWLDDATPLRGRNSTVADAAMALMFYYRDLAFAPLCTLLAKLSLFKAEVLLSYIGQAEPRAALNVCLDWAAGADPFMRDRAARLAWYIAGQAGAEQLEDDLYRVFTQVIGTVDAEIDVVSRKGVGRLKKYRHTVVAELLERFKQGDPQMSGYAAGELAATHFAHVTTAVEELIKSARNPERCSEALSSLCQQRWDSAGEIRLVELLRLGARSGLLEHSYFRLAIEYMLRGVGSEQGRGALRTLAREVVGHGPDMRMNMIYFAANAYEKEVGYAKLQDYILDLVVQHEDDQDNLATLLQRLGSDCLDRPDPLAYILTVGARLGRDTFHRYLIGAAYTEERFSAALARWLASDARLKPFGPTQVFLDRVRAGVNPAEAARSVIEDEHE